MGSIGPIIGAITSEKIQLYCRKISAYLSLKKNRHEKTAHRYSPEEQGSQNDEPERSVIMQSSKISLYVSVLLFMVYF